MLRRFLVIGIALGTTFGCATGNDEPSETDEGTGSPAGVTSGGSDGGASSATVGSASASSGQGAGNPSSSSTGGSTTTNSTSGSGGAGASGGAGGGSLEGTATTLLSVFAGANSSAIVANDQNLVTNMGFATPFSEQTAERVGLAMTTNGKGIAVVRAVGTGELRYAIWSGNWFPGFGNPLTAVEAGLTLVGGPAIASAGADKAHVVYQREDGKFYYAAIQSGLWSPTQEPMGTGADQSSGPVPPSVATSGGDPVVVFVGADGDLYDRKRAAGIWQPPHAHGIAGAVAAITPATVSLASGPELLVVFADATTHALEFTTFDGAVWSAPAPIPNAASDDLVSLSALPTSGAAIAYRATDGTPHTSVFSPADSTPWSEPPGLGAAQLSGTPAIASGAVGARAELIYVDATFIVYSSRLVSGAWTAPVLSGSSGERVAIVTGL